MVVGRAVNGWDLDTAQCTSMENTLNMILQQKNRFEDVVNPDGIPYKDYQSGKERVYHYMDNGLLMG